MTEPLRTIDLENDSNTTSNAVTIAKNNICIGLNTNATGQYLTLTNHSCVMGNIALNSSDGYNLNTNQNVPFFNNYAYGNTTNYTGFAGAGFRPTTTAPYDFSSTPPSTKYWINVGPDGIPA